MTASGRDGWEGKRPARMGLGTRRAISDVVVRLIKAGAGAGEIAGAELWVLVFLLMSALKLVCD